MRAACLALLLAFLQTAAASTTWYARSVSGEYGAEDGSSYANAFDGYFDIVWGPGGVEAGDTLILCGIFNDNTNFPIGGSGTANAPIVIDGDCSSQGDIKRAKLIAGSGGVVAFSNNSNRYLTIRNIEAVGGSAITQRIFNISASGESSSTPLYITLENISAHDTMGEGGTAGANDFQCIRVDGSNVTATGIVAYNCEGDGVYSEGSDQYWSDLTISRVDLSSTPYGDCFQYGGGTSSAEYRHNRNEIARLVCDHTNKATKHGVIFGCDSGAGTSTGLVLRDSVIRGGAYNVAVNYCDDVTLLRNYMIPNRIAAGQTRGVGTFSSSSGEVITMVGNVIDLQGAAASALAVFIDTSSGFTLKAYNNTIFGSGSESNSFGFYVFNPSAGTVDLRNNLIAGTTGRPVSVGASASGTVSNNALWNNSAACQTITCASSITADPSLLGGSAPLGVDGFCLGSASPLYGSGEAINASVVGYGGDNVARPASIGARSLCNARRSSLARPEAAR